MPQYDLRGIKVAKYNFSNNAVSYTDPLVAGDAMAVTLELKFAEGRLYAESALAEYMREPTGGTISIGVKYLPDAVQQLLFGSRAKTRSIGSGQSAKNIGSLVIGAKEEGDYVGVAFYAPDRIDGAKKFTCVKIAKAMFGPPSMSFQTKGESIVFNTPTTTGEFLADDSETQDLIEVAVCDTEADAIAWRDGVLA